MSDADDLVELSHEERRTIDAIYERRMTSTHYEILGVPRDAERKVIRDAYFALSKRFHPDVFFNRSLGSYRVRVDELFQVFTRAYDVLGNARHRAGYDLHIATLESPSQPPPAVVPEVTGIVSAARTAARAATPEPPRPSVAALPPPGHTIPRPVMPPIGSAVLPTAHVPAPSQAQPKVTPPPMQPLDPDVLRRAREAMTRRLNSAVPQRPSATPSRANSTPIGMPPASQSFDQIPRVAERGPTIQQLVDMAEDAQHKGDFAAATETLKQAVSISRDDESIRLRYEAVRKLFVTQQVDGHIAAARDAMRDGQPLVAAKHWEQAAEGRPADSQLSLNAAEVLSKHSKEFKRATDLAQRVLMSDPNNVKAHVILAGIFIKAGLKASAYASIQTIVRIAPDSPALKELREKLGPYTLAEKVGLRSR